MPAYDGPGGSEPEAVVEGRHEPIVSERLCQTGSLLRGESEAAGQVAAASALSSLRRLWRRTDAGGKSEI